MTAPEGVAARLDELEALHAAWQVGGWDGFEAGIRGMAALPDLIAAVRAVTELADEWTAEADDDERWLSGPRVGVSEAQEYPATIRQARSHADALTAALYSALSGRDDHTEEARR